MTTAMQNTLCWEAVWKLKPCATRAALLHLAVTAGTVVLEHEGAIFTKKTFIKKSFLVNHLEKELKTLAFRQLKQL